MRKFFTIDDNDAITVFGASEVIPNGAEHFASEKELAKLAAGWSGDRLVAIWNSFAGAVPFDDLKAVKRFTNRQTGVARVWKAIQRLEPPAAPHNPTPAAAAPVRKAAVAALDPAHAREGSKKAQVLAMLKRPSGATLSDIMTETGWQAHSVRGFISGSLMKKMGLSVESFKREDGERAYKVNA